MNDTVPGLLRPFGRSFAAVVIFQVIGAVAGLAPLLAVVELGRTLLSPGPVDHGRVWFVVIAGAAGLLVRLLCTAASSGIGHLLDGRVQLSFRRRLAARLGLVPIGWLSRRRTGELARVVGDDVSAVHPFIAHTPGEMVSAFVVPVVSLVYLFTVDWRLTLRSGAGPRARLRRHAGRPPRGRPDPGRARRRAAAGARAPGRAARAPGGAARRPVRLRRRPRGAARDRPRPRTGDVHRGRRAVGEREVHARPAAAAVLRPGPRLGRAGRRRPARDRRPGALPRGLVRLPGRPAAARVGRRQHRAGGPACRAGRRRRRGSGGEHPTIASWSCRADTTR